MSGGKMIIYLAPRYSGIQLLFQNYLGVLISVILAAIIFTLFPLVPNVWIPDILLLATIAGLMEANASLLAGKGKITRHNILYGLQVFLSLLGLTIGFYLFEEKSLASYVNALYFSYASMLLLSFVFLYPIISKQEFNFSTLALKASLRKSFEFQFADLLLLLVYRVNFYLVLYYYGAGTLGLFSVGVSILEFAWLAGRSISFIQFSKISNTEEQGLAANLSLSLIKISLCLSGVFLLITVLIPGKFYAFLFGYAFEPITLYMKWLVPGIWLHNVYLIASYYFAGRGENSVNIYVSLSGLICTFALGLILIPDYAISGAGIAGTVGFALMAFASLFKFFKENKFGLSDLLPNKKDKQLIVEQLQIIKSKSQINVNKSNS